MKHGLLLEMGRKDLNSNSQSSVCFILLRQAHGKRASFIKWSTNHVIGKMT